jgi:hypothetical protein
MSGGVPGGGGVDDGAAHAGLLMQVRKNPEEPGSALCVVRCRSRATTRSDVVAVVRFPPLDRDEARSDLKHARRRLN